jgi:hypothetical protein
MRNERPEMGKAEWALRPDELRSGRNCLAVIFDMRLGRFPCVVHRVFMVTTCQVRVMRCRLVSSCFVVLCGFLVVSSRVFMMFCCLVMMFCCFL